MQLTINIVLIAVYNNAYGQKDNNQPTYANVDYLSTYNSWGNSFYLHSGNGINITNSEIGQSGGAAIHLVDARKGSGINSPVLVLDETTTIENWISGEEAWFKAYGMSQTALLLKSGIETGISTTGRSIIQEIIDPVSGFMSKKINLILLTEPSKAAVTYSDPEQTIQNGGSETRLIINGQEILRPWNFLSTDPRVNSGQFAFPIGMYADWSAFQALIGDIVQIITPYYPGGTPEHIIINDATNLAMFAAFYNLTAQEVVNVNGYSTQEGISMKAATIALYPGKQAPNYLEINAPMPLFPTGFASVIVEFAPIS